MPSAGVCAAGHLARASAIAPNTACSWVPFLHRLGEIPIRSFRLQLIVDLRPFLFQA
jgi:hypothetical protein